MENRIANLEKHAAETRDRLIRIETTLEHTATIASVTALEARLVAHVDAGLARVDGDMARMRGDIARLESRLESRLEGGLSSVRSELRQEMAEMKVELLTAIGNVRSDLIKWSATMMLTVATLAFTAARFIH